MLSGVTLPSVCRLLLWTVTKEEEASDGMNLGIVLASLGEGFRGRGEGRRRHKASMTDPKYEGYHMAPAQPRVLHKPISQITSKSMDLPLSGWGGGNEEGHRDATENESA